MFFKLGLLRASEEHPEDSCKRTQEFSRSFIEIWDFGCQRNPNCSRGKKTRSKMITSGYVTDNLKNVHLAMQ